MQSGVKEREHYRFPLSPYYLGWSRYYLHHLSVTTHGFHPAITKDQHVCISLMFGIGSKDSKFDDLVAESDNREVGIYINSGVGDV